MDEKVWRDIRRPFAPRASILVENAHEIEGKVPDVGWVHVNAGPSDTPHGRNIQPSEIIVRPRTEGCGTWSPRSFRNTAEPFGGQSGALIHKFDITGNGGDRDLKTPIGRAA